MDEQDAQATEAEVVDPYTRWIRQVLGSPADKQAVSPDITQHMDLVELYRAVGAVLTSVASKTDSHGNTWYAVVHNNGYDAWVVIFAQPAGSTTISPIVRADAPQGEAGLGADKIDSPDLTISGDGLFLSTVSHYVLGSRPFLLSGGRVPGVVAQAPTGEDGAGLVMPQSTEPPPTPGLTADSIVDALVARMGGGDLRQRFEEKDRDAMLHMMIRGQTAQSSPYLDILAQFDRDRSYEGTLSALHAVEVHGSAKAAFEEWNKGAALREVRNTLKARIALQDMQLRNVAPEGSQERPGQATERPAIMWDVRPDAEEPTVPKVEPPSPGKGVE